MIYYGFLRRLRESSSAVYVKNVTQIELHSKLQILDLLKVGIYFKSNSYFILRKRYTQCRNKLFLFKTDVVRKT